MKLTRCSIGLVVLLVMLCGGAAGAARAQASVPEIDLQIAWDNHVRTPGWVELRVLANNAGADWTGELRITDSENEVVYVHALELPSHSRKQYRIPLFVDSAFGWTAALRQRGGATLAHELPPFRRPAPGRICVMADAQGLVAPGTGHDCAHTLLITHLADLPEVPMAWETIDVLLINGLPSAELTAAQAESLLAWVAAGGRLVVGGGPLLAQALDHLPAPLRVARAGEMHILDSLGWQDIAPDAAAIADADAVAVARLIPITGEVVWQAAGIPIAVRAQVGAGRVHILGWDLATPGSLDWMRRLWEGTRVPAMAAYGEGDFTRANLDALTVPNRAMLLNVPTAAVPAMWQWLLLFPLYMLVMGPGTLLIVRKLQRPILAWVLIPVWIFAALVLLSLALSGSFRRALPLVQQVAVAHVHDQDVPTHYLQGTAVYAPRNPRLQWASSGAARPMLGQYRFNSWANRGDPFGATVNMRADAHTVRVEDPLGVLTWGEAGLYVPPKLETDLTIAAHPAGLYLEGSLWSEVAVEHAVLLFNNGLRELRVTLGPEVGPTRALSATLDTAYAAGYGHVCARIAQEHTPYYYYAPVLPMEEQHALLQQGHMCHIAVQVAGVPAPIQGMGGTHLGQSCLLYTIPCPAKIAGDTQISLQPLPQYSENGWMSERGEIYVHSPHTTVQFVLPIYIDFDVPERILIELDMPSHLRAGGDIADHLVGLELWHWRTEMWHTFTDDVLNGTLQVEAAAEYIDAIDGVRFRLTPYAGEGRLMLTATVTVYGQW